MKKFNSEKVFMILIALLMCVIGGGLIFVVAKDMALLETYWCAFEGIFYVLVGIILFIGYLTGYFEDK